jgi:hypothetical protein
MMEIEWTYCEDRMPPSDPDTYYLVSVNRWGVDEVVIVNYSEYGEWYHNVIGSHQEPGKPYAWAPLPPPAPLPEEVAHDGD